MKKLDLNLASSPLKNRRLFWTLFCFLAGAFVAVSVTAARIYVRYGKERAGIHETIGELNRGVKRAQEKEKQISERIEEMKRSQMNNVDFLNRLVFQKSFSWMDFFAALETSLPESSYIVSLTPYPLDGSTMEVRFEAACADLKDLLQFVAQLDKKGFKDINIISESRTDEGLVLSEISVRYVYDV